MEEEIEPYLVPAILLHDGIHDNHLGYFRPQSPIHGNALNDSVHSSSSIDPQEALKKLLRLFTRFHAIFIKYDLDKEIIEQIFKRVIFYLNAVNLNALLVRSDLCNMTRGMQIGYNISQL